MLKLLGLISLISMLIFSQTTQASASDNRLHDMISMIKTIKDKVNSLLVNQNIKPQTDVIKAVQDAKNELNMIKSEFAKLSPGKTEKKYYKQYLKVIKNTDQALNKAFWAAKFAGYDDKNFNDNLNKFNFYASKVIESGKKVRPIL